MITLDVGSTAIKTINDHNFFMQTSEKQFIPRIDKRGKHKPKHALTDLDIKAITDHIFSIPKEMSHYTTVKKSNILPGELNVKKMWLLYKELQDEKKQRTVGYLSYLKVFNKYDLRFGSPAVDSCAKCDEFKIEIAKDPNNHMLIQERDTHLRDADTAYSMQRFDKKLAVDSNTIEACWMDMMSTIQIPRLSTSVSFYKRKLRVHAEDFFRASSKAHHISVWSELHGKKGTNDVISVLHNGLENVSDNVKHLILWMDNTSSQNKSSTLLKYLLHICTPDSILYKFQRVTLKFAPVGHTFMPCDRMFGRISQRLSAKTTICDPQEVVKIMNTEVTNLSASYLSRPEHYDWNSYLDQFYETERKFLYNLNQEPTLMATRQFSFGYTEIYDKKTRQTLLVKNKANEIRSKMTFDKDKTWSSFIIKIKSRAHPREFHEYIASEHDYNLPNKKIRDLKVLKKYIPTIYKDLPLYNLPEHEEDELGSSNDEESDESDHSTDEE